ncbi:MAG: hypothetical protein KDD62_13820, partial [Bdellovibrionales bacterium]|nr:hypothetical protein [Bdellovibrionales bacterium]
MSRLEGEQPDQRRDSKPRKQESLQEFFRDLNVPLGMTPDGTTEREDDHADAIFLEPELDHETDLLEVEMEVEDDDLLSLDDDFTLSDEPLPSINLLEDGELDVDDSAEFISLTGDEELLLTPPSLQPHGSATISIREEAFSASLDGMN